MRLGLKQITQRLPLCILMVLALQAHALSPFQKVVETDAHEGPTCVPHLNRLYFVTQPKFSAHPPYTSIQYLDLETETVHSWLQYSNMVNGMWLAKDKKSLLVAEQGTDQTPGGIAKINLKTKKRKVVVNHFKNKVFNSPNKALLSKREIIYFSDPNYGFLQGFKGKPKLHNAVYAYSMRTEQLTRLTEDLVMPHGLGLSSNEDYLYISDTTAIDSKDPINLNASHDIYRAKLLTPIQLGALEHLITVKQAVPDGFIVLPNDGMLVATKAGLYVYDKQGHLKARHKLPDAPINLTICNHWLFVTADSAIYRAKLSDHP